MAKLRIISDDERAYLEADGVGEIENVEIVSAEVPDGFPKKTQVKLWFVRPDEVVAMKELAETQHQRNLASIKGQAACQKMIIDAGFDVQKGIETGKRIVSEMKEQKHET